MEMRQINKHLVRLTTTIAFLSVFLFVSKGTANAATLTLTPATGVAGQEIIITGSAFDNSSTVTITWDGGALTTTPSTVTTSGAGAIPSGATVNVSFTVPSAMIGAHTVRASTGTSIIGVATFTINN